jgi:hypothetical protein
MEALGFMTATNARGGVIKERLTAAVKRLMDVRVDGETARITVPALYPSGSSASLEVTFNGGRCFVSDMGAGHMEAEFQGADDFFSASARYVSQRFGVGFDGLCFFSTWASLDRVEAAISAVASASTQAAAAALFAAERDRERRAQDQIFDRISGIFGRESVSKSMEISGKDDTWNAHNVVALKNGRIAVFEFVKENQNSIANKFLMFSDLFRSGAGMSLNSVVKRLDALGGKGSMLGDVSHVVEITANDNEFRRLALVV